MPKPPFTAYFDSDNCGHRFRSHAYFDCYYRRDHQMGVVSPVLYADVAIVDATLHKTSRITLRQQQVSMRWYTPLKPILQI